MTQSTLRSSEFRLRDRDQTRAAGETDPEFLHLIELSKKFQEGSKSRSVLEKASLSIARGELVAILGKSGSGKSTLLNLISGIDIPDAGIILLNGQDLTALSERERTLFRRRHIGFIFQFFNLIPTLTVWENILLPLELGGKVSQEGIKRANQLLEAVELPDRKNTYPDRLSGGEQQRVAIARALVNNPMLILADEPTGNLDVNTGDKVLKLIHTLARETGKNLVLVTHSRSAAAITDRVWSLKGGVLVAESEL